MGGIRLSVQSLVNRSWRWDERLQSKLAEGRLILRKVVLQHLQQRLGLLRTEINALVVLQLDLLGRILPHGSELKEDVLNAHPDLYAVCIVGAVVRSLRRDDGWLLVGRRLRLAHKLRSGTIRCAAQNCNQRAS